MSEEIRTFARMKRILLALLALAVVACSRQEAPETEEPTVSLATEISRQSRLYTSEYVVHKIVTHNDLKQLRGSFLGISFRQSLPIGDRKIAIPIDVTLQAYIDFSRIREEDVEEEGGVVRITLPDPRIVVTSSKVDNEGIKTHVSLLRSDFKDAELTDFARQGVASVVQTVPRMGIIESARRNAASVLIPLIAEMGYDEERIVVTFRKDFDESDLRDLYDNEGSRVKLKLDQ